MIVLGIDPGSSRSAASHTGIVLLDGVRLLNSWAIRGGIDGFREWHRNDVPWHLLPDRDHMTVVCERFVDRQVGGADRSPLLIEGAVRFLWPDVVLSPPSGYKTGMPDWAMEKMGFSAKSFGGDHHADRWSALRHALLYMKKQHAPEILEAFRGAF